MREIKFRAWCNNNRMKYSKEPDDFMGELYSLERFFDIISTDKPIIMQYTGFKDKNGVDIYYKDVVINLEYKSKHIVNDLMVSHWIIDIDKMNNPLSHIEVIGNIHENPKLLEDNK